MNELTPTQRRALRAAAHPLHPVVSIAGNGLSDAVLKEIGRALAAHELIKVKLYGIEREQRDEILAKICASLDCQPVQHIGNTLILWKEKPAEAPSATSRKRPLTKKQAAAANERRRKPASR